MFAPLPARAHLHALTAFNYEVGRLREIVRDPLAGEMRLTWWREALEGERASRAGHPVAEALLDTIAKFRAADGPVREPSGGAPVRSLRRSDAEPSAISRAIAARLRRRCSSSPRLILGEGRDAGAADASGHAGVAYAIAGLLRALPLTSARGQVYLPRDVLERHGASPEDVRARRGGAGLAAALRELCAAARGHLAESGGAHRRTAENDRARLCAAGGGPVYLARLERTAEAPFGAIVEVPQWRRQWALWRWARKH